MFLCYCLIAQSYNFYYLFITGSNTVFLTINHNIILLQNNKVSWNIYIHTDVIVYTKWKHEYYHNKVEQLLNYDTGGDTVWVCLLCLSKHLVKTNAHCLCVYVGFSTLHLLSYLNRIFVSN